MLAGLIHGFVRGTILIMLTNNIVGTINAPWGVTFEITKGENGYHKFVNGAEYIQTEEDHKYFDKYNLQGLCPAGIIFADTFGIEF